MISVISHKYVVCSVFKSICFVIKATIKRHVHSLPVTKEREVTWHKSNTKFQWIT